ncbi:MAG TPA: response regulator [Candidatus Sulfopaludibacter sp.]|nr:response regulator [Candidatus Sulfopaludibacter sp.]
MARIVFTGLERRVQTDLGRVLGAEGHQVCGWDENDLKSADAVFCNGDCPAYRSVMCRIRDLRPDVPIVVVTRLPESEKWLDALEAGADDYCSAPFEPLHVRWILSAVLSRNASRTASSRATS